MQRAVIVPLLIGALALMPAAQAHRAWLLPSATVLSGEDPWITIDAAVSNGLFYFEHVPGRLNALSITSPEGRTIQPQNAHTGKFRSSFDLNLTSPGTYRIAIANEFMTARYTENGETRRWRGTADHLATEVPADAQDLTITRAHNRIETFVTAGAPTETVFAAQGRGLELAPVTHPNDLFAGETARFRLLHDGEPAAGLTVTVIRGDGRYRDTLEEITLRTGEQGEFEITWPGPGMYWLHASSGGANRAMSGPDSAPASRSSYSVTLEVLPQ